MSLTHLTPPTADAIQKRYDERLHDYCYWTHEEVTVLLAEIQALRQKLKEAVAEKAPAV